MAWRMYALYRVPSSFLCNHDIDNARKNALLDYCSDMIPVIATKKPLGRIKL